MSWLALRFLFLLDGRALDLLDRSVILSDFLFDRDEASARSWFRRRGDGLGAALFWSRASKVTHYARLKCHTNSEFDQQER